MWPSAVFSAICRDSGYSLFSSFMEYIPAGVVIKDRTLRYMYVNRYLKDLYGEEKWEGKRAEDVYPGDPAVPLIDEEDRRALSGEVLEVFVTIPDMRQVPRRFRITKFPVDLPEGERLLGYILDDITELAETQEKLAATVADRETLLKEVHHRIKNNLATVASLLSLASVGIEDPKAVQAFTDSRSRVESLALLHDELYISGELSEVDFAGYLRNVAERVFHSWSPSPGVRMEVSAEPVVIPMSSAVPLALMANELLTNAMKYAFADRRNGRVSIELARHEESLELRVRDDGPGLPDGLDPARAASLGFVLLHQLARQIGASVEYSCEEGASFLVRSPLSRQATRT